MLRVVLCRDEFTNFMFLQKAQVAGHEGDADNWRLFPADFGDKTSATSMHHEQVCSKDCLHCSNHEKDPQGHEQQQQQQEWADAATLHRQAVAAIAAVMQEQAQKPLQAAVQGRLPRSCAVALCS